MADAVTKRVREYQRELFSAFDEFFRRIARVGPEQFDGFKNLSVETWPRFADRFNEAGRRLETQLERLYNEHRQRQFQDAKLLGGTKLVLGGGSRFYGTQREAVARATLYTDTILIPDPVYAWTEVDRQDDAFSVGFEVFRTIHSLLLLRPLIDLDAEILPLVVFPSFEKGLERDDPLTQEGIRDLATAYFNAGLNTTFATLEDVFVVARDDEETFIDTVQRARLFVPRGARSASPDIRAAVREYREWVMESRGAAQVELARNLNDGELLALAILESVAPQFHLLENSVSLDAQPFMSFPNHWFYYQTLTAGLHRELTNSGVISPRTAATVEALQRERFAWMANIEPSELIAVRQSSGFVKFRKALDSYTSTLAAVQLGDIDRVGAEVAAGIASLLDEHDNEMREIATESATKHTKTAIFAGAGLALTFSPALASVLAGASAFGLLTRYVFDKIDERRARNSLARSLLGVLARARDTSKG